METVIILRYTLLYVLTYLVAVLWFKSGVGKYMDKNLSWQCIFEFIILVVTQGALLEFDHETTKFDYRSQVLILFGQALIYYRIWEIQVFGIEPKDVDYTGKTVIITGCNSGIGFETAKYFARNNATLICTCRSADKFESVKKSLSYAKKSPENLTFIPLDLSNKKSILDFVKKVEDLKIKIDLLINNAGVMAVKHNVVNGIEENLLVNHLGTSLLTARLLPHMQQDGKIIMVGSSRARKLFELRSPEGKFSFSDWDVNDSAGFEGYGVSKFMSYLFVLELKERLKENKDKRNIEIAYVSPGSVATNISRNIFPGLQLAHTIVLCYLFPINKTPRVGSFTTTTAANHKASADKPSIAEYWELSRIVPALIDPSIKANRIEMDKSWKLTEKLLKERLI